MSGAGHIADLHELGGKEIEALESLYAGHTINSKIAGHRRWAASREVIE
jgi:hypothetical protein